MASKRKRGSSWEFIVKRAGLLDKPLTFTFKHEADGDEYCRKLEALLDRGIVPTDHMPPEKVLIMEELIESYLRNFNPSPKDVEILHTVIPHIGSANLLVLDANWVDTWITWMKQDQHLAPATIRAKVGAVARCVDWGVRKKLLILPDHPFRTLPQGYASYTANDLAVVGEAKVDKRRIRRLESGEEPAILAVIEKGFLTRKYKNLELPHPQALHDMFVLALETSMRLREMYTISTQQINLSSKAIYLDKTKNGDSRSVPLSSIALSTIKSRAGGEFLFPWWDGTLDPKVLKLMSNYLSKLYQGIFHEAGCVDLHFHDLRAEAISRLYERTWLSDVEISLISGHRNLQTLREHYARLRPSNLADKLW